MQVDVIINNNMLHIHDLGCLINQQMKVNLLLMAVVIMSKRIMDGCIQQPITCLNLSYGYGYEPKHQQNITNLFGGNRGLIKQPQFNDHLQLDLIIALEQQIKRVNQCFVMEAPTLLACQISIQSFIWLVWSIQFNLKAKSKSKSKAAQQRVSKLIDTIKPFKMNLNLSFEEFCSQNKLMQIIQPPPYQNQENVLTKINDDQKAPKKKCISNEIYDIFIDFFSKQNKYQLIGVQEFDTNIQHLNGNIIEGVIETYRQNGLDIMKIINQYAYQIREIELKFLLYLVLFFAKDVIQQNSLKCEVRAYRIRYLYNFKSKINYGRVDLCYSTFKYGSFKIELKSLSPSDYQVYSLLF
ncbi:hypothetical protein ABPG72_020158 [Tetrahymena utriculariae]